MGTDPILTTIDFHNRLMCAIETGNGNVVLEIITDDRGRNLVVRMWRSICGNVLQGKNEGVADLHLIPNLRRILDVSLISLVDDAVASRQRSISNIARLVKLHAQYGLIGNYDVLRFKDFVTRRFGAAALTVFEIEYGKEI